MFKSKAFFNLAESKPTAMNTTLNIAAIKPNQENPRFIRDEKFKKLVRSIKEFPEMLDARPLVIDENNVVLGGNMRLKALQAAGVTEVPVKQVLGWTEEQKKEFIIKDNLSYGEWDYEMIANHWEQEQLQDWGMDIPEIEIEEEEPEAFDDDYQEPEDLFVDVKEGDIIQIGEHWMACLDSTKTENWKQLLNAQQIDLVVTDPPYNIDYQGGTGLKIMNDKMENNSFYHFLLDFYTATNEHVKPGGAWYVWHADTESLNFRKAMIDSGILLKQCLIWVKNTFTLGRQDYQWRHEPCLYGWKEGAAHWFTHHRNLSTIIEEEPLDFEAMKKQELVKHLEKLYGDFLPGTTINQDKPSRSAEHPTMKPIPLVAGQIKNSSKKGQIVADGFLGSGSTMVAAHQLNRRCYGFELDPKYCQVVIDRMAKLDQDLTIKINGEEYQKR